MLLHPQVLARNVAVHWPRLHSLHNHMEHVEGPRGPPLRDRTTTRKNCAQPPSAKSQMCLHSKFKIWISHAALLAVPRRSDRHGEQPMCVPKKVGFENLLGLQTPDIFTCLKENNAPASSQSRLGNAAPASAHLVCLPTCTRQFRPGPCVPKPVEKPTNQTP